MALINIGLVPPTQLKDRAFSIITSTPRLPTPPCQKCELSTASQLCALLLLIHHFPLRLRFLLEACFQAFPYCTVTAGRNHTSPAPDRALAVHSHPSLAGASPEIHYVGSAYSPLIAHLVYLIPCLSLSLCYLKLSLAFHPTSPICLCFAIPSISTSKNLPSTVSGMKTGRDNTTLASVEAVVAQARSVYQRARGSGPRYSNVTAAVRALYSGLEDLHTEARNPASLFHSAALQHDSVFLLQHLTPVLGDCASALQQLDCIVGNYGPKRSSTTTDHANDTVAPAEFVGREEQVLASVQAKLESQTTDIAAVLNSVKLHQPGGRLPSSSASSLLPPISPVLTPDEQQLEDIKGKADAVAARLASNQYLVGSLGPVSPEELWNVFRTELAFENCTDDILDRHKVSRFLFCFCHCTSICGTLVDACR